MAARKVFEKGNAREAILRRGLPPRQGKASTLLIVDIALAGLALRF